MVTYASFARLENAIVQQHKQSSKPLPDVGALGNPPKGDFRMPGTLEQAQAHLRSSRELNDLAILGASRGQQTSMLELHFAGKHRDAASNFVHHSCSYQGPGGFYALESFVINHNQVRGLLEARKYEFASQLLDLHSGSWVYNAGMPMERMDEVDFVGSAMQYLGEHLNVARS